MNALPSSSAAGPNGRWNFIRDVAVFQLKMFLDNVRDLVLMPVSLGAALLDLVFRGEREGSRFYRVLRWGAHSEEVIDVYSAIQHHDPGSFKVSRAYTVDGVIERLEGVVRREVEKGSTASNIKSAMERAIRQLHSESRGKDDAITRSAEELRRASPAPEDHLSGGDQRGSQ